jgi:hypothetical protein
MRFFLDNCLAIRHARALNEIVKPDHTFTHLQEKFSPSTADEEWIRGLGQEQDWVVISGDHRVGKSAHERAAWHESGLTVFFLSNSWTSIPLLQQHSKLTAALPQIIEKAASARSGTGFLVALNGKIARVYP